MGLLDTTNRSYRNFNILFWITQIIGILICVITIYWLIEFRNGFGVRTNYRIQELNLHIVFAMIGMVYFCALEILSFRALRWFSISWLKLLHAIIGFIVIVSASISIITVYDEKNYNRNHSNWNSLHSWMGIMVIVLFVAQWIFSLIAYIYPKLSVSIRIGYLPLHVFFGLGIFLLLVADAELGYQEAIKSHPFERQIMNSTCLLLAVFTALVTYLTIKQNYKRIPLVSEEE